MNRYQDILGRINYWLFLLVVALLPFPQTPLRYACVLWIVSWFLEGRWLSRPKPIKENRMAIPFIIFGAWYAWSALSGLWAPDHAVWAWQMERYMTFGLIVPVGIWGLNSYYDWRQTGKVLIWSCIIAVPVYICAMTFFYVHPELIDSFQWREPWDLTMPDWYSFFGENISHFKHRLFICSVELFGAVVAWQLWRKERKKLIPALLVMLSFIPLSGSRQSILTFAIMLAVAVSFELPRRLRMRYSAAILLLGLTLGTTMLAFHPRMQNFNLTAITEIRQVENNHDIRFNIWGTALQQPEDYLWYGLGAGQSKEYIRSKFAAIGYFFMGTQDFHPHNQYLEVLMELGIFGLLFFLLAWVSIPLCAKNKGRQIAILLVTLFLLNMCTDCMFGRFCGIALWAVGMLYSCSMLSKTR